MRQVSLTIQSSLGPFALAAVLCLSGAGCDDNDDSNNAAEGGRAGANNSSGMAGNNTRPSATTEVSAGGRAGAPNVLGAAGTTPSATTEKSAGGGAGAGNISGTVAGGSRSATSESGAAGRIGIGGSNDVAVGGSAGAAGTKNSDTPNGIWQTEGYGYVAELGTGARLYELSAVSCINSTENPFMPEVDEILGNARFVGPGRIVLPMAERTSPLTAVPMDHLPELCSNGGTPVQGNGAYHRSPQFVFDVLWNTFNEQYAFFQTHAVDWAALKESYRAKITDTTTDEELFETLANLIRELDDGHVNLGDLESGMLVNAASVPEVHQAFYQTYQGQTEVADWPTYQSKALRHKLDIIQKNYLGVTHQQASSGSVRWGKLNANTGYLGIDSMAEYTTEATASLQLELEALNTILDEAFTNLSDTKDLVVDVRFNGGGYDQASLAILSRLIKSPLDVFTKQARNGNAWTEPYTAHIEPSTRKGHPDGRLVVLTSALTASAAEIFTLGTLGIPGTVRIGEATEGAFSDVLVRVLPNRWLFTLSNERYTDPQGHCYEGEGIPVHEQVGLFLDSDLQQEADTALDAALRKLGQ